MTVSDSMFLKVIKEITKACQLKKFTVLAPRGGRRIADFQISGSK